MRYRDGQTLYRYKFENNLPKDHKDYPRLGDRQAINIYDHSELEARKKFRVLFKIDAGKLIERKPW